MANADGNNDAISVNCPPLQLSTETLAARLPDNPAFDLCQIFREGDVLTAQSDGIPKDQVWMFLRDTYARQEGGVV